MTVLIFLLAGFFVMIFLFLIFVKNEKRKMLIWLQDKEYMMLNDVAYVSREGKNQLNQICDLIFCDGQIFVLPSIFYFRKFKVGFQPFIFYWNPKDIKLLSLVLAVYKIRKVVPGGKHFFVVFEYKDAFNKLNTNQYQLVLDDEDIPKIYEMYEKTNWPK